ncbi:MAG: PIN domain-containing protein [Candidatus Wallbacteria bacterium]|nr:PIN domain-containing protein [Candidatus Wallbacteria bacterium]
MKRVFADTSFWVALFARGDDNHARATTLWRGLSARGTDFVTSDYVFDETMTLLARRAGHAASVLASSAIRGSPRVRLLPIYAAHWDRVLQQYEVFRDGFSFTDVSSFVLMRALRLTEALSFDADFTKAGFETLR